MIGQLIFGLTALLYTVAATLFLLFVAKGSEKLEKFAGNTAFGGGIFALISLYFLLESPNHRAVSLAIGSMSFGTLVLFLIAARIKRRIVGLGAFLLPVVLVFHLASGFSSGIAVVSGEFRSAVVPFHVAVNILGIVAFSLAAAAGLAYVIQEHALRSKKVVGAFERLPALHILDATGFYAVLIGFPLLTLGIATGTFWIGQELPTQTFTGARPFAFIAWMLFAQVLALRAIGWRGRRAALGTIFGFIFSIVVLVGYVLQSGGANS